MITYQNIEISKSKLSNWRNYFLKRPNVGRISDEMLAIVFQVWQMLTNIYQKQIREEGVNVCEIWVWSGAKALCPALPDFIFWICAVPTRPVRAECLRHLLFSISPGPRCIAAVCWFLLRGRVLRPDDACQKRVSWFSDWIQKVQKRVNLVDLVKSFQT